MNSSCRLLATAFPILPASWFTPISDTSAPPPRRNRCRRRRQLVRLGSDGLDYVPERLPFRVEVIQTDNGVEFGASFHWHVLDKGIGHV